MKSSKRSDLAIIVSATALLLVPCVWLPQIESLDLCSHIYNAWLARLITEQHIPGLVIARQSTNILFDNLLTLSMTAFGPVWAQRILVSTSAVLFFWSSFVLIAALSNRRPWFLLPCLAVLSYGRIFHYGFFNFYVALAFGFLALSLLLTRSRWWQFLFVLLLALSWIAHPLPALLTLAASAYISIVRDAPRRIQLAALCGSAFLVLVVGVYERIRFPRSVFPHPNLPRGFLTISGWDQVLAFNRPFSVLSYRTVELGILFVFVLLLIQELRKEKDFVFSVPLQLYVLACFASFVLPDRELFFPESSSTPWGSSPNAFRCWLRYSAALWWHAAIPGPGSEDCSCFSPECSSRWPIRTNAPWLSSKQEWINWSVRCLPCRGLRPFFITQVLRTVSPKTFWIARAWDDATAMAITKPRHCNSVSAPSPRTPSFWQTLPIQITSRGEPIECNHAICLSIKSIPAVRG